MAHTPTPWQWDIRPGQHSYLQGPADEDCILEVTPEATPSVDDAEFILRACNSHDALLAALEGVASAHAHIETCNMPAWLEAVEDAIAAARGEA